MFAGSLASFWSSESIVFSFLGNLLLIGILTTFVDAPPIVARSYSRCFELLFGLSAFFFELSFCTHGCIRIFELFFDTTTHIFENHLSPLTLRDILAASEESPHSTVHLTPPVITVDLEPCHSTPLVNGTGPRHQIPRTLFTLPPLAPWLA